MAQWVKVWHQAWCLELHPWDPQGGGEKWLLKVVLWSLAHHAHVPQSIINQSILKLWFLKLCLTVTRTMSPLITDHLTFSLLSAIEFQWWLVNIFSSSADRLQCAEKPNNTSERRRYTAAKVRHGFLNASHLTKDCGCFARILTTSEHISN